MARKETREEAISRADRSSREAFTAQMALQAAVLDELTPLVTVRWDGWTIRTYTTGLTRVDGGFIVLRSDMAGQRAYVTAHNTGDYLHGYALAAASRSRLDDQAIAENRIVDALRHAIYAAEQAAA